MTTLDPAEICTCRTIALSGWDTVQQAVDPACPLHATTSLDPAYCADGCGRLAETERPTADGRREQVCSEHASLPCGCILGSIHTRADHATLEDR